MKKVIITIIILLLGIISYQTYYYIEHKANTIIVIGNQDNNINEKMIILIDNKELRKFTLKNHFSSIEKIYLSFGKHKITLKGVKSNINYETTIFYFGIFNWNYIEYNNGQFYQKKFYISPNLD